MWPPRKIIFPVDFSDRSSSAARYVRTLACRFHSEICLIHVLPVPVFWTASLESRALVLEDAWDEQKGRARRDLVDFAAGELAPLRVEPMVLEGEPAGVIVGQAREQNADVIVMATHGYSQFRRFILGSVTAKVLHDADCPVWTGVHLAEGQGEALEPKAPIKQVACAVDLSANSQKVLESAAHLADSFGARLFVIHAIQGLATSDEDYYQRDWRESLAGRAREQVEQLQQRAGTAAQELIVAGEVPRAVCSQAAELGADVLVIGRSAESGLFGRLRTNAYAIIRGAHCAVLSV
ncbi:MAG TPA: universal stress protein [Bryobacteraceae bacterium]|nr:universal stress protein [Bryobacteraceae bacterium]